MKQWPTNETLKPLSEKQCSYIESSSSKRNKECNELLLSNVYIFIV